MILNKYNRSIYHLNLFSNAEKSLSSLQMLRDHSYSIVTMVVTISHKAENPSLSININF